MDDDLRRDMKDGQSELMSSTEHNVLDLIYSTIYESADKIGIIRSFLAKSLL
jgi:hypothetical protein